MKTKILNKNWIATYKMIFFMNFVLLMTSTQVLQANTRASPTNAQDTICGQLSQVILALDHFHEIEVALPKALFDNILRGVDTDKSWKALYHYHTLVDAGLSLQFNWVCFWAILEKPDIFYSRYMASEEEAFALMKRAMLSDGGLHGNLYHSVNTYGFKDVKAHHNYLLQFFSERRTSLNEEQKKRHDRFVSLIEKRFEEWEQSFPPHLRERK